MIVSKAGCSFYTVLIGGSSIQVDSNLSGGWRRVADQEKAYAVFSTPARTWLILPRSKAHNAAIPTSTSDAPESEKLFMSCCRAHQRVILPSSASVIKGVMSGAF